MEEFDPYAATETRLTFRQTPWVIGKYMRGLQMNVPESYHQSLSKKRSALIYRTDLKKNSKISLVLIST